MSKTVAVLVVKPLVHQGRSYVRGDRMDVSPTQALAYRRKGYVTLTRGVTIERPPEPEPRRRRTVRASTVRRRQSYQTRDMVAAEPE